MGTGEGHILAHVLLVDLRAGHRHLRVGEHNGDLVAVALDVTLGELAEVDPGLQLRIDGDGNLAVAKGKLDVELSLQQGTLQPKYVVVGYNLVHTVLCRIEPGTSPDLCDEHRQGVDTIVGSTLRTVVRRLFDNRALTHQDTRQKGQNQ